MGIKSFTEHLTKKNSTTHYWISIVLALLTCSCFQKETETPRDLDSNRIISIATQKYDSTLKMLNDTVNMPRNAKEDGSWNQTPSWDWTSGFFSGILWQIFELTGEKKWAIEAQKWSNAIEHEKNSTDDHDLGFQFYCSYGNELRLYSSRSEKVKEILLTAANSLVSRYNPNTGVIRSWDWGTEKGVEPTIIDNMMNLELLLWASKATGDSRYKNVALSHADSTIDNHFRDDFSTFHEVDYDSISGAVVRKKTVQGFSDTSMWARGQAWAIYGYTMMYRETSLKRYLFQSRKAADAFIGRLPKDTIPYWDFDSPDIPNAPKDASAAAIAASALFELSSYADDQKESKYYTTAHSFLNILSSDRYLSEKTGHKGLILHSVGFFPKNSEVDEHIIYADYYYLEALNKYLKLKKRTIKQYDQ